MELEWRRSAISKEVTKDANKAIMLNLERRRSELGINIREFSERLGISYQTYRNLLRGTTSISAAKLFQIADYLNIDVEDLFKMKDGRAEVIQ